MWGIQRVILASDTKLYRCCRFSIVCVWLLCRNVSVHIYVGVFLGSQFYSIRLRVSFSIDTMLR